MTTISVIVAAWNASQTIARCVESVMAQQDVGIELIIVDDCSTDTTVEVVTALQQQYPQLKLLRRTENGGPSRARNQALEAASGEWIAVVDADDTIEPQRLSAMVKAASQHQADIVFDDLALTYENPHSPVGNRLIGKKHAHLLQQQWTISRYTDLNKPYESQALVGFLKPLLRKDFLDSNRIRYQPELYNSEDYILILECLIHGAKVTYLDDALYNYYIYSSSLSGRFNPEAHQKLIEAERGLLERCGNRLAVADKRAIERHIDALLRAGITNALFQALRQRKLMQVMCILYGDLRHAPLHLWRIAKSAWNVISRGTTRGK